ncbi:hypothetical protein JMJ35_009524 [Cladonia borealis]|uniref:Uncharacterized protein n=1 Tax=Cladonia borealis TaxID=184061 RepID=A0AA39QT82_9LECA|nr:hypothetical protein JMJ35_009524 [Cladonia borealis]
MYSFKATCRRASLLVLILQLCSLSHTATLPALNLTYIKNGLSTPNLTLTYNAGYKPRAPEPYLATAYTETVLFFEYGLTPLDDATLILVLYQMYTEYQPHTFQSDAFVGTKDKVYTYNGVTLVIHPNAKMTWNMFHNTWLLLGHYQTAYQCVAMEFDITHSESFNVGWGQVRLV